MERGKELIATALSETTKGNILLLVKFEDAEYQVRLPILLTSLGETTLEDVINRLPFTFFADITDGQITTMRYGCYFTSTIIVL